MTYNHQWSRSAGITMLLAICSLSIAGMAAPDSKPVSQDSTVEQEISLPQQALLPVSDSLAGHTPEVALTCDPPCATGQSCKEGVCVPSCIPPCPRAMVCDDMGTCQETIDSGSTKGQAPAGLFSAVRGRDTPALGLAVPGYFLVGIGVIELTSFILLASNSSEGAYALLPWCVGHIAGGSVLLAVSRRNGSTGVEVSSASFRAHR